MESEKPRKPTPAAYKIAPNILYDGNLYPYLNYAQSGFYAYISTFKRIMAPLNPFAKQQFPDSNSLAFGIRDHSVHPVLEKYPSSIKLYKHQDEDYDVMSDPKCQNNNPYVSMISPIPNIRKAYAPRHCVRQVQIYKRCLLGNDQDKGKCKPEAESILAICPAFALDQMKESNYGRLKQEALDDQKYRRAMAVPQYNNGRTVADIANKKWEDGTRKNLRPDSYWPDDRYADVTQADIDAAKERIRLRNKAKGIVPTPVHVAPIDRRFVQPRKIESLYP